MRSRLKSRWQVADKTNHRRDKATVQSVVWIDATPYLEIERAQCRKVSGKVETLSAQMERYRQHDEPSYQRWMHSEFGEQLSSLRELSARHSELEQLVDRVEADSFKFNISLKKAYERVMQYQKGMDKFQEMFDERRTTSETSETDGSSDSSEFFDSSEFSQSDDFFKDSEFFKASEFNEGRTDKEGGTDRELPPEVENLLWMMVEDMLGPIFKMVPKKQVQMMFENLKQEFINKMNGRENQKDHSQRAGHDEDNFRNANQYEWKRSRERATRRPEANEIKQVYRSLARRLHPDMNPILSEREKELWHDAQQAYSDGDLYALETIWSVLESHDKEGSFFNFEKITSLSRLKSLLKDLQKKLRATQKLLRDAKKTPSWDFSNILANPVRLKQIRREVDREFREATTALKIELENYEKQIETWSQPRKRAKKNASSRANAQGAANQAKRATQAEWSKPHLRET